MIYRTTEQFFPSSYIKKRRKFQKDQRVIRDRIWRFYAHYSYPKRIVSETRPTATSLDNINPTPPPFSRKISQRRSEKARNRNWQNVVSNAITFPMGVTFSRLVTLLEDTREVFKLRCYAQSPFSVSCVIYQRGEDQRGLLAGSTSDWSAATPRRLTGVAPLHPWTPSPCSQEIWYFLRLDRWRRCVGR